MENKGILCLPTFLDGGQTLVFPQIFRLPRSRTPSPPPLENQAGDENAEIQMLFPLFTLKKKKNLRFEIAPRRRVKKIANYPFSFPSAASRAGLMRHVRKKKRQRTQVHTQGGRICPSPFSFLPSPSAQRLGWVKAISCGKGEKEEKMLLFADRRLFFLFWEVGSTVLYVMVFCLFLAEWRRIAMARRERNICGEFLWENLREGGKYRPSLLLSLSFLPSSDPNLGLEEKREENGPSTSSSLLLPSPTNANHVFTPSGPQLKNCPPSSYHSRSHMDNAKNIPFCLSPFSCESAILGSSSSSILLLHR